MKNIFKNNYIFIISFLILLMILLFSFFLVLQDQQKIKEHQANIKEYCLTQTHENEELEAICKRILKDEVTIDFYYMFNRMVVDKFNVFLAFSIFLFVSIPTLLYVCKCFINKSILNEATRSSYRKFLKKLFKTAYKSVWIIPSIILIAFIISYCSTKSFDASYSLSTSSLIWNKSSVSNPFVFMSLYMLNVVIHSILYVNISLCVARYHHNYFVAIMLSFLTFIGIELFLEIAINGIICLSILKTDIGLIFNIINLFTFNETFGIITPMLVPFILMLISFIVLFLLYRNKERLIIDCEKNE